MVSKTKLNVTISILIELGGCSKYAFNFEHFTIAMLIFYLLVRNDCGIPKSDYRGHQVS